MTGEFISYQWKCNRCGKWNKIRKVFDSGEHLKTCKCGRTMQVTVRMECRAVYIPKIIGLRDIYRRCNRGKVTLSPKSETVEK